MRKEFWICVMLYMGILGLLLAPSCVKKTNVLPDGMEKIAAQPELEPNEDDCREKPVEVKAPEVVAVAEPFVNEDIFFNFDSAELTAEAVKILKRKVDYMNENPELKAIIEGHCDERGTNEYNLALGDRRAQSAKSFMENMGISLDRLSTISYGEEHPLVPDHREKAWSKNRRAHFVFE